MTVAHLFYCLTSPNKAHENLIRTKCSVSDQMNVNDCLTIPSTFKVITQCNFALLIFSG